MNVTKLVLIITTLAGPVCYGAAKNPKSLKQHSLSPEQREQMAVSHEEMAACLRSDKPLNECMKEMMQSCHDFMGEGECPMGMMDEKMRAHNKGKEQAE